MKNTDQGTVTGFGREWSTYDQGGLGENERQAMLDSYFLVFPWDSLPPSPVGADLGCGSGRWASLIAARVHHLHAVDASDEALASARRQLAGSTNITFHHASVGDLPFADASLDFAYCLGVLHHVPNPAQALREIARVLRPTAPLLLYLYYDLGDRPSWYRLLWRMTDVIRRVVSRLPFPVRRVVADAVAVTVYWPLARTAAVMDRLGRLPASWPLAAYRHRSLYALRTDALDRLGTRLERRFSRAEIQDLLQATGYGQVLFSDDEPYWCLVARRATAN